jgi:hypothetical protein
MFFSIPRKVQTRSEVHSTSMGTVFFPEVKRRGVKFTAQSKLVPRLKLSGATSLFPLRLLGVDGDKYLNLYI